MSQQQPYQAALTVAISHDYFKLGQCGVAVTPTMATARLLKRWRMLFRQSSANCWIVLSCNDLYDAPQEDLYNDPQEDPYNDPQEEAQMLEFEIRPRDAAFWLYTRPLSADRERWRVEFDGRSGVHSRLTVSARAVLDAQSETVNLRYRATECLWEFLIIPQHSKPGIEIKLADRRDRINFMAPITVFLPNLDHPAFRVVTARPQPLRERYDYSLRLWEVCPGGDRLLRSSLHPPAVQSRSMTDPNAITSYIYI